MAFRAFALTAGVKRTNRLLSLRFFTSRGRKVYPIRLRRRLRGPLGRVRRLLRLTGPNAATPKEMVWSTFGGAGNGAVRLLFERRRFGCRLGPRRRPGGLRFARFVTRGLLETTGGQGDSEDRIERYSAGFRVLWGVGLVHGTKSFVDAASKRK